ncbi:MAG: serine/threonine protein kinase [Clostridiales bacterium GWF2_36_10]|nr:MAG: serine/threonine protein kinase [Clostridiales bacterium GWF2_36_10]HAN20433.1 serine/threonine protein kinase [Clostridiales bacterium]
MTTLQILIAFGIPSSITGFFIWQLKRSIDKAEKARQEREVSRVQNETLVVKGLGAAFALGEAAAEAIQKGEHNGELSAALAYAQKVKHEQKDFLTELGIKNLYSKGA